jgi:hypothetical protein
MRDENVDKELNEILNYETHVDIERLREIVYIEGGLSQDKRNLIWSFLLNVKSFDKSNESLNLKILKDTYTSPNDINRVEIFQDLLKYKYYNGNHRKKYERILNRHLNDNGEVYHSDLIYFVSPFIESIEMEYECSQCFEKFMKLFHNYFQVESINLRYSRFNMLFRLTQPQLYQHFVEEELEENDWALGWISTLLSRVLPISCVIRLFEVFFSLNDFELHIYIALALLQHLKTSLLARTYSELLPLLNDLPEVDVDKMVKQAINIREFVKEKEIL